LQRYKLLNRTKNFLGVFMKKNIAVISILFAAAAQTAFANGVEKTLPLDATNVKISTTGLDQVATGQKLIADSIDGPVYESTYSTMLNVVVTYDSKDKTDAATALNNSVDNAQEEIVGGPTLSFELPVSAAEVAAIKSKSIDASSLVAISVAQQDVQVDNEEFTSACRFDNDSSQPEDSSCIKHTKTTVSRPVLSVVRK
jgi:hypothetical protein